jgi:uncharacterized protein
MDWVKFLQHLKAIIDQLLPPSRSPPQLPTGANGLGLECSPTSSSILSTEITMINISAIQTILQNFVSDTPDIQGATLVSPDGLTLTSALPERVDEERIAAMTATILSIGERIGRELARGNVERVIVVGEKGYSVLASCGDDAVLLVLASATVKQGLLFLEIKRTLAEILPLLTDKSKISLLT